jgi:hypothetical protein
MLQQSLERPAATSQQKRLVLFYYNSQRAGKDTVVLGNETTFELNGDAEASAQHILNKIIMAKAEYQLREYRPFVHSGVEYHPVYVDFKHNELEMFLRHLDRSEYRAQFLLHHPVGGRMVNHLCLM